MSAWSLLLNYGVKAVKLGWKGVKLGWENGSGAVKTVAATGVKAVPGVAKTAVNHPIVATAAGLGGWSALESALGDKTFGENVRENAKEVASTSLDFVKGVGKGSADALTEDKDVQDTTKAVADTGKEVAGKVKDAAGEAANRIGEATGSLGGMLGNFVSALSNVFGGVGRMFNGLTGGNVSGLGIAGLIASAYLVFGRSGLLGKAGGLLMGIMLLSGMGRQHQAQNLGQDAVLQQSDGRGKQDDRDVMTGMHR